MHVTLKSLREHRACYSGYNKVVRFLQSKPFTQEDDERESYIQFKHNEQISLVTIVESNGLEDALWTLRCVKGYDRDFRLFAVWSARQVQHLMIDQRSIDAVDVSEKFANGEASENELDAAWDAAWAASRAASSDASRAAARVAEWAASWAAARAAEWAAAWDAAWAAARDAAWDAAWAAARDASRAASWAASRDAAWAAARDAARVAEWAASRDAAWDAQKEMFIKMCKGNAPWQKTNTSTSK